MVDTDAVVDDLREAICALGRTTLYLRPSVLKQKTMCPLGRVQLAFSDCLLPGLAVATPEDRLRRRWADQLPGGNAMDWMNGGPELFRGRPHDAKGRVCRSDPSRP